MVERYRPGTATPSDPEESNPFLDRKEITFLNTGCTLLNCIIGGGWPFGRIVNIVGDKSTGKTLLAEEAIANLFQKYPKAKAYYRESEAAFDKSYAQGLGVDVDRIDFGPSGPDHHWQTIEEIIDDLRARLDAFDAEMLKKFKAATEKKTRGGKVQKKKLTPEQTSKIKATILKEMQPSLYIVDSLDSLSSETELARNIHEGSYNLTKQKLMGELFRTEVGRIKRAKMCVIFISQIRDRIGPMIRGNKYTRSGGKALDFYASIVLYLSEIGKVPETIKGIKRLVAVKIKAKCQKNKITMPFRECEFEIRFGYGIDDDWACLDFLKSVNRLKLAGFADMPSSLKAVDVTKLKKDTVEIWTDIEKAFIPPRGKYAKEETAA